MPQPKVEVTQKAPKKYTLGDQEFTKPRPENLGEYADNPIIKNIMAVARGRASVAVDATQDMGILDKDVRATWPTNTELAKRRTFGRRKSMSKWELALWEAHRSPETGVPPSDVYSEGPGKPIILEN